MNEELELRVQGLGLGANVLEFMVKGIEFMV
jgi:hypothetical protein